MNKKTKRKNESTGELEDLKTAEAERKKAEESLRRRDAILEAVSLGAEQFLKGADTEENIQKLIKDLGKATDVSRVYIFENHPGQDGELLTSQRYEWVAEGIEPQAGRADLHDFPWQGGGMERWEEKLSKNEVISGQIREFPESEQDILLPQDILSIVAVPISIKRHWWGFIGFDECGRERQWTSSEVDALKTASGIIGAAIERKKTEEVLRESEEKFRAVLEAVPDLMIVLDSEGRYRDIFTGTSDLLVAPSDQLLGKTIHEVMPKKYAQPIQNVIDRTLSTGKLQQIEYLLEIDGVNHWFAAQVVKFKFQNLECVLWSARDITKRKNVEEALHESEERLELAVTGTNLGLWDHNFVTGENTLNRLYAEMLSYAEGEIGPDFNSFKELVHPDDLPGMMKTQNRHLEGETPFYETEFRMRTKTGEWKWIQSVGRVSEWDDAGKPLRIIGTHRDITKRKRVDEAIERAKRHWEKTFDTIPDLIMILDDHYRIVRANRPMADKLGIPVTKLPGLVCYQAVHGLDAPPDYCPYAKLLEDGREHTVEVHLDHLGGDYMITTTTLRDREGHPIGAVHVARDITRLKETEEALRESEERLELAMTGAKLGLWDQDIATGKDIHNWQWAEMLGYTPEEIELENITWENLLHPEDFLPALKKLNEHLAGKTPFYEAEFRMRTRTGGWKWIQSAGRISEWDNAGKPLRMLGTHRDITKRKQAEEALRESEERLELAVTGTNLGLWDWNMMIREDVHNRQWAEMLGYTMEEIEPKAYSWKKLVHPDDSPRMMEILNEHFEGNTPFYEAEFRMRTKTGEWKWIQSVGRVSERDDEGKPLRMIGTHRDITERKQVEEELAKHREHLEEMVEERTSELRSMVNAMAGREVRMGDLKDVIKLLRKQIEEAGMVPVADDPLLGEKKVDG